MGILQDLKSKVSDAKKAVEEIRQGTEDFKSKHKMSSQVVSKLVKGLPPPFNTFGEIIWDGLEKQDDSDQKMLDILERIENNNEEQFREIISSINNLIENNASKSDLQQLGEEILDSNKKVVSILDDKVDEILHQINQVHYDVTKIGGEVNEIKTILADGAKYANISHIQIQELRTAQLHPRSYRRENKTTFVGREYYINKVKDSLKDPGTRVSIVGLGGTGKSELAFKALHSCEDLFYQIIPFYFESEYKFEDFLTQLAGDLSLSIQELEKCDIEGRIEKVLDALDNRGENRSLIFADNYEIISGPLNSISNTQPTAILSEDIIDINNFLNSVPMNTSILLTSRERKNIDNEKVIDLEGLDTEEGKELFIKLANSEYLRQDPPEDILKAIEELVKRLGGHPLSIEILARTYKEGSVREEIQNMSAHLGLNVYNPRGKQERFRSLNSCFEYSINQIEQDLRKLLYDLVLLNSPFSLSASEIFGAEKHNILDLFNRSLLQRIDHNEYGQIREQEYWLYIFHPSMRNYLNDQKRKNIHDLEIEYGSAFSEYYLRLLYDTYDSIGKENHLLALARFNIIYRGKDNDFERVMELTKNKELSANASSFLGKILYHLGMLSTAFEFLTRTIIIYEEMNDKNRVATEYTNVGKVLNNIGRLQEALEYFRKALMIEEELNHRDAISRNYENIGDIFRNMGRLQEALEYFRKALVIEEELNHRDAISRSYENIALVLTDMGRDNESREYHKRAAEIMSK